MREIQWWPRWWALCCTARAGVVVTSDRQPDPREAFVQVPHFPIHHHHHHHHLQHHHDHHHQDHHHHHHDHRHHHKVTGRTVDHDADHYFMFDDMVYLVCTCGLTYSSPMWKSLIVLQVQKCSDIHNAAQRPFSGPLKLSQNFHHLWKKSKCFKICDQNIYRKIVRHQDSRCTPGIRLVQGAIKNRCNTSRQELLSAYFPRTGTKNIVLLRMIQRIFRDQIWPKIIGSR